MVKSRASDRTKRPWADDPDYWIEKTRDLAGEPAYWRAIREIFWSERFWLSDHNFLSLKGIAKHTGESRENHDRVSWLPV